MSISEPSTISSDLVDERTFDLLFREARTHYRYSDRDVPDTLLLHIHNISRMGPTSSNGSPMRVVFVKSAEAKADF